MGNKRIELEYVLKSTPKLLFNAISMPSGLSTWFADRVDRVGDSLNFFWNKSSEIADVLDTDNSSFVRYQWDKDRGTDRFFEIRIIKSEITGIIALHIIAIVEKEDNDFEQLWNNSIKKLKLSHGAR